MLLFIPIIANVGVMIDQLLYYPGDSFSQPNQPVDTLAIPAAAPWLKVGESIEFLKAIHPRLAFPTHDAILSSSGKAIMDRLLSGTAAQLQTEYKRIDGETIEI